MMQLVQDEGDKFPFALNKGRYVDDLFGGADFIAQAQIIVQVHWLYIASGFPLHKWISNQLNILESIPIQNRLILRLFNLTTILLFILLVSRGHLPQIISDFFCLTCLLQKQLRKELCSQPLLNFLILNQMELKE